MEKDKCKLFDYLIGELTCMMPKLVFLVTLP